MKKLFVVALAAIALVACSKNDTVELSSLHEIRFENKFVKNPTRAAVDPSFIDETNPLTAFNVWGFMDKTDIKLWEAEEVEQKTNDEGKLYWHYDEVQYWMPGHTYYFAALAPMNSTNWQVDTTGANNYGLGKVTFTNVDGSEDLIYSATTMTTPDTYDELFDKPMDTVKFRFNHLLSRVKFTFANGFPTDNVTMIVKNVTMEAPKGATIDLAVENWWDNTDDWQFDGTTEVYDFGDVPEIAKDAPQEAANVRLLYPTPSTHTYTINFDVEVYMSGVLAMEVSKSATLTGRAIEMGKAYNFKAVLTPDNLGLLPIEFEVEQINGWVVEGDVETTVQ